MIIGLNAIAASPAIKIFGNTGLVLRQSDIEIDKQGLITGSAVFSCPIHLASNLSPQIGDRHPLDYRIHAERVRHSYSEALCVISCQFAGMEYDKEETGKVYELQIGTGQEPIEVHPEFEHHAGTPAAPRNGAQFVDAQGRPTKDNDKGMFDRWASSSPFKGMDSFLDASNITFRESYTARVAPSNLNGVGKISSPPSAAPSVSDNRNWLFIGMNISKRGRVYSVRREWRLSARGGWKSEWYS